jgi:DNA-binding protein HU-beta
VVVQMAGLQRSLEGKTVNKSQLIDQLANRFEGNRKQAAHALESVLDTITREVARGEKVAITGFGSFERRVRKAGTARNPSTGEKIRTKKKNVPKFTPGQDLKNVVSGAKKLPKLTLAAGGAAAKKATAPAKKAAGAATRSASGATSGAAKKTSAAKKSAPAKKASSTGGAAKKTAAKQTSTAKKSAPAKKASSTGGAAKKTAAKKTSTAKKAAKKS